MSKSRTVNPSWDGYLASTTLGSFTAARLSPNADTINNTGSSVIAGWQSADNIYRAVLAFDTSFLGNTSTVVSATIRVRTTLTGVGADSLGLVSFSGAGSTLVASDYNRFGGELLATAIPMTTFGSPGTYTDLVLTAAGIAAINKGGTTAFGLRGEGDRTNIQPADSETWVWLGSSEHSVGSRPELTIVYTTIDLPTNPYLLTDLPRVPAGGTLYWRAALRKSGDAPVDLTLADEVRLYMREPDGTAVVDGGVCDILDAKDGIVAYRLEEADLATAGRYFVSFVIDWGGAVATTIPGRAPGLVFDVA